MMEKIKIAHLYYDLMNLYGEHGNILGLAKALENHGVKVITHYYTISDEIPFEDYDLFYIGSGNEENFELVRKDILSKKESIQKCFDNNQFFLITGNALNLFGKTYTHLDEKTSETLGILNYESCETDFRIVGEQVYTNDSPHEIIGFENRSSVLKNVEETPLFHVKQGTGYAPNKLEEGIQKNHFYGTYLLGPIMIRNPYFKEELIKELLKSKDIPYEEKIDSLELKAYEEYQKNLLHEEN